MNKTAVTITSDPTARELTRRVLNARAGLTQDNRAMVRAQGARYVRLAQEEAPKRTGEFAQKIFYRTFEAGDVNEIKVYVPQPLGKWITGGTKPHIIRAKNAPFLRFFWPKVGKVVFFKSVNHPGTKANPFLGRAYRRWYPGAAGDLRKVASNWSRTIQGAGQVDKGFSL